MDRTIEDFVRGEVVYHKTNYHITMVVIGTIIESKEVTCRWIDKTGKEEKRDFFVEELKMVKDRPKQGIVSIPIRRRNDIG